MPSNHYHVGFRVYSASSWLQVGIDDFAYEVQPSCVPPSNATALPASTTALLSWSHGTPSTTGSVVTWGPAGYNPGTGTVSNAVNVSATSYNITGLTSNTAYTAWVADSCGAGNISPWHGPINFTTSCVAATLPYSDNFDVNPLPCWDFTGGSQTMTQYATASGYAMRGNFWSWTSGNDAYLTSRPVTISANSEVSFNWSHQYMSSYPNDQLLLLGKNHDKQHMGHLGEPGRAPQTLTLRAQALLRQVTMLTPRFMCHQATRAVMPSSALLRFQGGALMSSLTIFWWKPLHRALIRPHLLAP